MITRVFKQDGDGSPIYGVIMTQAELDLVSELLGHTEMDALFNWNLWEQMAGYQTEYFNLAFYTSGDQESILIKDEKERDQLRLKHRLDLEELEDGG